MTVTPDYNYDPLEWARMTARRADATPAMIAAAIPVLRRAGDWMDHVTADELARALRHLPSPAKRGFGWGQNPWVAAEQRNIDAEGTP